MRSRSLILVGVIITACVLMVGCVKNYVITRQLAEPIATRTTFQIGAIGDNLPMDMDPEDKPTLEQIDEFKRCIAEELQDRGDLAVLMESGGAQLEVTGGISEFKKGSGALRFFIGFGAGKAKVAAELSVVDKSTNKVIFAGVFKQEVSGWAESGSQTWKRIAKDFAKALEKENNKLMK